MLFVAACGPFGALRDEALVSLGAIRLEIVHDGHAVDRVESVVAVVELPVLALGLEGRERVDGLVGHGRYVVPPPVHLGQVATQDALAQGSVLERPQVAGEPGKSGVRQGGDELRTGRGFRDQQGCFRPHGSRLPGQV